MEELKVNNAIFKSWVKFYSSFPFSDEMREAMLNYVGTILSHQACVIFDSEHLAKLLCIENERLFAVINGTDRFYRTFEIKKRSGGMREIRAPYPSLKAVQWWIYNYVLRKQYVHGCAHGFRPKKSIVTNVKTHVEGKCLLKLDLKDFFPSIKINKVVQVFKNIGYTDTVSWLLAKLCCLDDELPQGAPTSPVLSNIIARSMDKRLYRLAKRFDYRYSRYADDISFSGEEIPVAFIKYVTDIIEDCGFFVNSKKIRLYREHDNKSLTGVAIKNGVIKLPREKRRSYEQDIYYAIKYGVDTRIKGDYKHYSTYILSLIGKANFWLLLEPDNKFVKESIPKLQSLFRNAIGAKDKTEELAFLLASAVERSIKDRPYWGVPMCTYKIGFEKAKMLRIDVDLRKVKKYNIAASEIEKLATGIINGLNRNIITDYTNMLEQIKHDETEVGLFELKNTNFGLSYPQQYTYLYGGVIQESMMPEQFRSQQVDFDESVVWAVDRSIPEMSLNVQKLPEVSDGMKRIEGQNLYYKYEGRKLTVGVFVGYSDYYGTSARKIKIKFE